MPGSSGFRTPGQSGNFRTPAQAKRDELRGTTEKFEDGWPRHKDHDPRNIAAVYKNRPPYQVRTADGTFSQPKGLGMKNREALTKDKAANRNYVERKRPNVAGFQG